MGLRKMGPSKTNVWNSPFSPQGSTLGGKSRKNCWSSSRPAKVGSSTLGSTQAARARKPVAWNLRFSTGGYGFLVGETAASATGLGGLFRIAGSYFGND